MSSLHRTRWRIWLLPIIVHCNTSLSQDPPAYTVGKLKNIVWMIWMHICLGAPKNAVVFRDIFFGSDIFLGKIFLIFFLLTVHCPLFWGSSVVHCPHQANCWQPPPIQRKWLWGTTYSAGAVGSNTKVYMYTALHAEPLILMYCWTIFKLKITCIH